MGRREKHEPFIGQHRSNQFDPAQRDSLTGHCRLHDLVILIESQKTFGLHSLPANAREPIVPVQPRTTGVVEFEQHLSRNILGRQNVLKAERGMRDRTDCLAEQQDRVITDC